jgi:Xaa-Pro dipeptidase
MPHFTTAEYADRLSRTRASMAAQGLDAMLLFAPESHYWLTGYDTFGFCFFQCMVVPLKGEPVLLTRSADLRQARHTSILSDIRFWKDGEGTNPASDLKALLKDMGLHKRSRRLGVEFDTQGLTAHNWRLVEATLTRPELVDASRLVPTLRLVKSAAEIAYVRKAGELSDHALDAAVEMTRAGAHEGAILAGMQGDVLARGGDYAGNEFIIGSGEGALLCRYFSGRRRLDENDQLTLEWSGAWRRYHAPMMNTLIIGTPRPEHLAMREAVREALLACEAALKPGNSMGEVFNEHVRILDERGYRQERLNACGYSVGARFNPCWMDSQMFFEGAETEIVENMVFFLHMILMDSETGAAQCLGRSSLVTANGPECLSRSTLDLIVT